MIKITERLLTETEKQNLEHNAPFFLLRKRREIWHKELKGGIAEILEVEVSRAWGINICTCCANSYFFQVDADKFLYVESWELTKYAYKSGEFPKRKMKIERLPFTKKVLNFEVTGDYLPAEERQEEVMIKLLELPNYGETECEMFEETELSDELRSKLYAD